MKRYVKANEAFFNLMDELGDVLEDKYGKVLYHGRLSTKSPEEIDAYIEGVQDAFEASGNNSDAVNRLHDLILEYGANEIRRAIIAYRQSDYDTGSYDEADEYEYDEE